MFMPDELVLVDCCLLKQRHGPSERLIDTYLITDLCFCSKYDIRWLRPIPPQTLALEERPRNHLVL